MLHVYDSTSAKKPARALEKILQGLGLSTTHGQARDILAKMAGFTDWNAAHAQLQDLQQLDFMELEHAEDAKGNRYGHENALRAHTGFELRYDAEEDAPSYVRVCDSQGRECAYWTSQEWQDDPEVVMGAILGCLVRGQAVDVGSKTRSQAPSSAKLPSVFDIPLDRLFRIIEEGEGDGNGFCRVMDVIEVETLAWRTASDVLAFEESTVAAVYSLRDGAVDAFDLHVEDIRPLVWDAARRCFVHVKTGNTWRFLLSQEFGAD